MARFTTWGRQFWRITGDYFTGAESVKVWVWLGGILLLVVVGVRLAVLFTYQGSDMMTAFQVVAAGVATGDDAVKDPGATASGCPWGVLHPGRPSVARIMLDLLSWQRFCWHGGRG